MPPKTDSPRVMATTQKSLRVLNMVRRQEEVTPSDVAERFDMSRGSAYTHLATLLEMGYVVEGDDGYRLGLPLVGLGQAARRQYTTTEVASSVVSEVSESTGEQVRFTLEEGDEVWYLCGDSGEEGIDTGANIGASIPPHASAAGKAILAEVEEEKREAMLSQATFEPYNSNTTTDKEELLNELETVKQQGYALNEQEITEWINAGAVPVTVSETSSVGALCVIGPAERLTRNYIENDLSDKLLSYANKFEVELNREIDGTISPY